MTLTTSQLRRLSITILLGCIVLLPAFVAGAPT